MAQNYPEHLEFVKEYMGKLMEETKEPLSGFAKLHKSAVAEGALSKKTKELMSLSIAICIRCDGCIAYHIHDALEAGATREEILETISVAILMGGGPALMYGCEALQALEQFEA